MKKLALAIFLTASSLCAQVQIGKNVQIGGAGSGTGTVTTVSGTTANGLTVSVASPSTTPAITVGPDGSHVIPVNTGSSSNCLRGDGTYAPCSSGSGLTGQTPTCAPKATTSTTSTSSLPICDDGTNTTITHPLIINSTTTPSQETFTYNTGHPLIPGSSTSAVYGVDSSGDASLSEAGAAASRLCTAANGVCPSGLPSAASAGQIISSTGPGTTYSVVGQMVTAEPSDTLTTIEANTQCSTACTYVVPFPQAISLTANTVLPANICLLFMAGGEWNLSGGAYTFNPACPVQGTVQQQHFSTSGGVTVINLLGEIPVEWFGAVGVWNSTIPSFDSTSSINATILAIGTGCAKFQPIGYMTSGPINMNTGKLPGLCGSYGGIVGYTTTIFDSSPTGAIVEAGSIPYASYTNLVLKRTVLPTDSSAGFDCDGAGGINVDRVSVYDADIGFRFHGCPNFGIGNIKNAQVAWDLSGYTTQDQIGYFLDSTDGTPENSILIANANTDGGNLDMKIYGAQIRDVTVNGIGGTAQNGILIQSTGSTLDYNQDIHINNSVLDQIGTGAGNYAIKLVNVTNPLGTVDFSTGYNSGGGTCSIDVESSSGVTFSQQSFINGSVGNFCVNNSSQIAIGSTVTSLTGESAASAIELTNSSYVSIGSTSINGGFTALSLTGSSYNQISASVTNVTNLVTADSASGNNMILVAGAGTITNAGSNNTICTGGSACGSGGGAVTSVANSDGTLTVSPTTGPVVASLALGHPNIWTGAQTFGGGSSTVAGLVVSSPATGAIGVPVAQEFVPGVSATSVLLSDVGVAGSTNNTTRVGFSYVGGSGSASNWAFIGLWPQSNVLGICSNGAIATDVTPNGGGGICPSTNPGDVTLPSGAVVNINGNTWSGTTFSAAQTLPNGSAATTQSPGDNTTKVATDAFVIANAGTVYPGAGIPKSTGSAWGTSYTATGTGTFVPTASGALNTGHLASWITAGGGVDITDSGLIAPISNAVTSATGGSGTGTVACATASCTNLRGSYTVAGGTFATGTLLTLVWPTTTGAYVCNGSVLNNATGASIGYHSVATATGMTFSSLSAATGLSVDIDYACQP